MGRADVRRGGRALAGGDGGLWAADPDVAPPGGQSFAATGQGVLAALDRLLATRPQATVLVVSHVTPMKMLLRHALLAPPQALRRMHLDVACLCETDWYGAGGPGVIRSLNDSIRPAQVAVAGQQGKRERGYR